MSETLSLDDQLWCAIRKTDEKEVKRLLGEGADPNYRHMTGCNPIHYVSDPSILRMLIEAKANVNATVDGNYALHLINNCPIESFKLLIEANANVNAVDPRGATPLQYVAVHDNIERCKLLLAAKADPHAVDVDIVIPDGDEERFVIPEDNRNLILQARTAPAPPAPPAPIPKVTASTTPTEKKRIPRQQ